MRFIQVTGGKYLNERTFICGPALYTHLSTSIHSCSFIARKAYYRCFCGSPADGMNWIMTVSDTLLLCVLKRSMNVLASVAMCMY